MAKTSLPLHPSDLHGLSRLGIDGVRGVTDIVEHLHHAILRLPVVSNVAPDPRTGGIPGVVYRSIHGVTGLVGGGLELAFSRLAPRLAAGRSTPSREHLLAVINGVLGDHLAATNNPLAIEMNWRQLGRPVAADTQSLTAAFPQPRSRLLVTAHGLCMHDGYWHANGQADAMTDVGLPGQLAREAGFSSIDLHYNTGRHISDNGRDFARRLEDLVAGWPVAIDELVILGHSMGGLIARSAVHYGVEAGHRWPGHLKSLVFLGTPHHGSPLERAGNGIDRILGFSRYSAPFSRIGKLRSAGITDLRHGNILEADWAEHDRFEHAHDTRHPPHLPVRIQRFAVAASASSLEPSANSGARTQAAAAETLKGDGLVPVTSALGLHPDPNFDLAIPEQNRHIAHDISHIGLLRCPKVAARVGAWLATPKG
ncbi:MAG: hypothetical protein RQ741_03870 [Wenzhouxiangellaceae bacterium]|nr:hypothetical protein [Wenzhouxiangellaceae bacterium]